MDGVLRGISPPAAGRPHRDEHRQSASERTGYAGSDGGAHELSVPSADEAFRGRPGLYGTHRRGRRGAPGSSRAADVAHDGRRTSPSRADQRRRPSGDGGRRAGHRGAGIRSGRFELRMPHSSVTGPWRGRRPHGRPGRCRADRRGRHPRRVDRRDRQASHGAGRGARNRGRSRQAGPGCGLCRDRSPRPERGSSLRRRAGLGSRRTGEAGRARARSGQRRNLRGRRRPAPAAGKRGGRRVDRPRLPGQPLDLPPGRRRC